MNAIPSNAQAHREKDAERTPACMGGHGLTQFCVLMNYVTVRPQWFSALLFCLMNEGKTTVIRITSELSRKDIFNGRANLFTTKPNVPLMNC